MWKVFFINLAILSILAKCDDFTINVNNKKVVNVIKNEFVSFSVEPESLFDGSGNVIRDETFRMAKSLSPAYLKIYGTSSSLKLTSSKIRQPTNKYIEVTPQGWKSFNQWAIQAGIIPVIVLDWSPKTWQPKDVLNVLAVANSLGVRKCLWQLGSDFNMTDSKQYIKDLKTLKTMVDAFPKNNNGWGILSASINKIASGMDDVRFYYQLVHEIVQAITWTQEVDLTRFRIEDSVFTNREILMRGISKSNIPIWLDLKVRQTHNKVLNTGCDDRCLTEGLLYAQLLGDSAKNGFTIISKSLEKGEVVDSNLNYFISLVHKKTVGNNVFEVKSVSGGDRFLTHFYSYCGRNVSGALTLMVVNKADHQVRFFSKILTLSAGTDVHQYILTTSNTSVQLNEDMVKLDSPLEPTIKYKPLSRGLTLMVPPKSIGFFVLTNVNVRECQIYDEKQGSLTLISTAKIQKVDSSEDSMKVLLKELIEEQIENADNEINGHARGKRDLKERKMMKKEMLKEKKLAKKRPKRQARPGLKIALAKMRERAQERRHRLRHIRHKRDVRISNAEKRENRKMQRQNKRNLKIREKRHLPLLRNRRKMNLDNENDDRKQRKRFSRRFRPKRQSELERLGLLQRILQKRIARSKLFDDSNGQRIREYEKFPEGDVMMTMAAKKTDDEQEDYDRPTKYIDLDDDVSLDYESEVPEECYEAPCLTDQTASPDHYFQASEVNEQIHLGLSHGRDESEEESDYYSDYTDCDGSNEDYFDFLVEEATDDDDRNKRSNDGNLGQLVDFVVDKLKNEGELTREALLGDVEEVLNKFMGNIEGQSENSTEETLMQKDPQPHHLIKKRSPLFKKMADKKLIRSEKKMSKFPFKKRVRTKRSVEDYEMSNENDNMIHKRVNAEEYFENLGDDHVQLPKIEKVENMKFPQVYHHYPQMPPHPMNYYYYPQPPNPMVMPMPVKPVEPSNHQIQQHIQQQIQQLEEERKKSAFARVFQKMYDSIQKEIQNIFHKLFDTDT